MAVPEEWLPTTEPGLSAGFHSHSSQITFTMIFHALICKDIIFSENIQSIT